MLKGCSREFAGTATASRPSSKHQTHCSRAVAHSLNRGLTQALGKGVPLFLEQWRCSGGWDVNPQVHATASHPFSKRRTHCSRAVAHSLNRGITQALGKGVPLFLEQWRCSRGWVVHSQVHATASRPSSKRRTHCSRAVAHSLNRGLAHAFGKGVPLFLEQWRCSGGWDVNPQVHGTASHPSSKHRPHCSRAVAHSSNRGLAHAFGERVPLFLEQWLL